MYKHTCAARCENYVGHVSWLDLFRGRLCLWAAKLSDFLMGHNRSGEDFSPFGIPG